MSLLHEETLSNGLVLTVEDQSNRYFGDYHRVRVVASCTVPVGRELFAGSADPDSEAAAARRRLGTEVRYEKILERMGVAGAEVETTRQLLLQNFLRINRPYLARDDFAIRFIFSQLRPGAAGRHC